jgi:hypothetical protein
MGVIKLLVVLDRLLELQVLLGNVLLDDGPIGEVLKDG